MPNRREALKWGGMALAGTLVDQVVWPLKVTSQGKATPRNTARNVILIEVAGAISPGDCWDFKENWKQPKDLDVRKTPSGVYLSKTLFPQLSDHTDKVAIVRSMRASELVHFNGQYHTQTGRALNAALAKEIPAFGSIIAYELESQRRESDTFPTYFTTTLGGGFAGSLGAGFLPARFSGVDLTALTVFDTFGGGEGGMNRLLEERWAFLGGLSEVSLSERKSLGNKETDFKAYYYDAYRILNDPRWSNVFQATDDEKQRYGADEYGLGLILAKNLIAADAGTRFVYVYDGNRWDQHTRIFDRQAQQNHYVNCLRFDKGYVSLLTDLAKMPGRNPGKSLLDETIIVATSEFGRTPDINPVMGRHHWRFNYSSMLAGGGIKGGTVIGKTENGYVVDTGWKHKEQPQMDNVVATLYSALGIDWKKRIENTPSKRAYEYVQAAPVGGSEFITTDAIDELFA
jgi:hypothetical protein